jgi:hypothetical protein
LGLSREILWSAEKVKNYQPNDHQTTLNRKEVVVMATHTNRTATQTSTHATTETHASPEPGKFDKVGDMIKNHLFEIGLVVVGLLTILALHANGFRGVFVYDDAMGVIIGIFNVVIMVYPLILAIKNRQWLRLGIIVASIVFAFFALPILVRVFGPLGKSLWATPVLGPIVLPLAAVFFNIAAAYMLANYGPKGPDVAAQEKGRIPGLRNNVTAAETRYSQMRIAAATRTDSEADAKAKFEKSDKKSKARAEDYQTAKKAYDVSSAVVNDTALKAKLKTNENSQKDIIGVIDSKVLDLKRATAVNVKAHLQGEIDSLDVQLGTLIAEGMEIKAALDNMKIEIENSPKKVAMDDAFTASEKSSKATLTTQEAFESATKSAKKADTKLGVASADLTKSREELNTTNIRITEAKQAQRGGWRSVVFWPIFALVGAFGFYPLWYSWVLSTFH